MALFICCYSYEPAEIKKFPGKKRRQKIVRAAGNKALTSHKQLILLLTKHKKKGAVTAMTTPCPFSFLLHMNDFKLNNELIQQLGITAGLMASIGGACLQKSLISAVSTTGTIAGIYQQQRQIRRQVIDLARQPYPDSIGMVESVPRKIAVAVDGSNLFHSAEDLGLEINYPKLRQAIEKWGNIAYPYLFTGINPRFLNQPSMEGEASSVFEIIRASNPRKTNLDAKISYHLTKWAYRSDLTDIVLVSGDNDFLPCVEFLLETGKTVKLIGFQHSTSLRLRQLLGDDYIEITTLEGVCVPQSPSPDSALKLPRRRLKTISKPVKKRLTVGSLS